MDYNNTRNSSLKVEIQQSTPFWLNTALLLDIFDLIKPFVEIKLPKKRSGFQFSVFVLFQACIELSQISPDEAGKMINYLCKKENISFQIFRKEKFTNGKKRKSKILSRPNKSIKSIKLLGKGRL